MPNMKNAKKRVLVNIKKEEANNNYNQTMKTAIKNVERAINSKDKEKANEKLSIAIKAIDKAKQNGAVAANTCSRNKSRLTKKVNNM